jgi:hypothetical protein
MEKSSKKPDAFQMRSVADLALQGEEIMDEIGGVHYCLPNGMDCEGTSFFHGVRMALLWVLGDEASPPVTSATLEALRKDLEDKADEE